MPKLLTWDDAEDLGILLSEAHPELDPLAVRFTDLHRYVTELPDFEGDEIIERGQTRSHPDGLARGISGPDTGLIRLVRFVVGNSAPMQCERERVTRSNAR